MTSHLLPDFHGRFAETLGWTLLHSLWQLALLAALSAGAFALLRQAAANTRYVVACLMLLLMLVVPVATFRYLLPAPPAPGIGIIHFYPGGNVRMEPATHADALLTAIATPAPPMPLSLRLKHAFQPFLPAAVCLYLLGTALMLLRLLLGYARLRAILARARALQGPALERLQSLARRMNIRQKVRLLESAAIEVPTLIGALKPVILLPAAALTGLSPDQLAALLAHELAHIRRYDYLLNLAQSCIETLLFYHPGVWWLGRRIRLEREHCCDDAAVAATDNRLAYARALAAMESLRVPANLALAAGGAGGGTLLARIKRLLHSPPPPTTRPRRFLTTSAALALMLIAALVYIGCNRSTPAPAPTPSAPATSTLPATLAAGQFQHAYDIRYLLGPAATANTPESQKIAQSILETIQSTVAPESWRSAGGTGELRLVDGQLTVIQTRDNLLAVDQLLQQLFETRALGISVEFRALLASDHFMDDFRIGGNNLSVPMTSTGNLPTQNASIIDDWTLNLFLTAARSDASTIALDAPRVTTPNGYPVEMGVNVPAARPATASAPAVIGFPDLASISARFTPVMSADRRYVVFTDVAVARSKTVFPEMRRLGAAGSSAPSGAASQPRQPPTMFSLPDGGTLLIDGGSVKTDSGGSMRLLLFIRPNLMRMSEGENQVFQLAGAIAKGSFDTHPAFPGDPSATRDQILVKAVLANMDDAALKKMNDQLGNLHADALVLSGVKDLAGSLNAENIVSRPQIVLNDGEEGSLVVGQMVPQIKGFHDEPGKGRVPDVEQLQVGFKLGVRATHGAGGKITLDLDASWSKIAGTQTLPSPGGAAGEVLQVPVLDRRGTKTSVTLENDASAAIFWLPPGDDPKKKPMVLIVTPHDLSTGERRGGIPQP